MSLSIGWLQKISVFRRIEKFEEGTHTPWSANDWLTAVAGEMGEAANLLKKVRRGDFDLDTSITVKNKTASVRCHIGDELADVTIYLVLLADNLGIDLENAVIAKFNEVSDKRGSKWRISHD